MDGYGRDVATTARRDGCANARQSRGLPPVAIGAPLAEPAGSVRVPEQSLVPWPSAPLLERLARRSVRLDRQKQISPTSDGGAFLLRKRSGFFVRQVVDKRSLQRTVSLHNVAHLRYFFAIVRQSVASERQLRRPIHAALVGRVENSVLVVAVRAKYLHREE